MGIPENSTVNLGQDNEESILGLQDVFRGTCVGTCFAFRVTEWGKDGQWQRPYTGQCTRHEPATQVHTLERATCHTPPDMMDTPLVTSVTRPSHQNAKHEPERVLWYKSLRRRDLLMTGEFRGRTVQPKTPYSLQNGLECWQSVVVDVREASWSW